MIWLQKFYIGNTCRRFKNFKWNKDTANFSCPYCGDSDKDEFKARGYFYTTPKGYRYKCHNCQTSKTFYGFMKDHDEEALTQYKLEVMKSNERPAKGVEVKKSHKPKVREKSLFVSVREDSECLAYLKSRKIPSKAIDRLFYTDDLIKTVREFVSKEQFDDHYRRLPKDKRILIPFTDRKGNIIGFHARAVDPNAARRYIAVKSDENTHKIVGLDAYNPAKPTLVVEGAFDSFFLPNCIAMNGIPTHSQLKQHCTRDNAFIILDNQPRNKQVVDSMRNLIEEGYRVNIWKELENHQGKDINQMVIDGIKRADIVNMIARNSYRGARAILELNSWQKIDSRNLSRNRRSMSEREISDIQRVI